MTILDLFFFLSFWKYDFIVIFLYFATAFN